MLSIKNSSRTSSSIKKNEKPTCGPFRNRNQITERCRCRKVCKTRNTRRKRKTSSPVKTNSFTNIFK